MNNDIAEQVARLDARREQPDCPACKGHGIITFDQLPCPACAATGKVQPASQGLRSVNPS